MKDTYRGIFLCVAIVLASSLSGDQAAAFGEGSWSDSVLSGLGVRAVQVAPYVKVGYQRMGVNLNVPIGGINPTGLGWFTMNDMDVKLEKQEFLIGTLGVNTLVRHRIGFFAEASVSAERAGSVTTVFSNLPVPNVPTNPTAWSWPSERVRWWEVNLGGSLKLRDSEALLLGYKFDQLSENLTHPPGAFVQADPLLLGFNYNGDIVIRTWSPYIGLRLDDRHWRFDLIWSPWLTTYRVQMPLRLSHVYTNEQSVQEGRYVLSGGGGNLLEAYGEAKFNIFELLAAKLWLKASWLNCRGNGNRDYVGNSVPFGSWSASDSALGSLTRNLWAFGLAGEIKL